MMKQLVCVVLVVCVIACDNAPSAENASDAAPPDAADNTEAEAGPDAASHGDADAGMDAARSTDADAGMDAAQSAQTDAGPDAASSTQSDAMLDAASNTDADATLDAAGNADADAALDAAGNTQSDAGPDATLQDGAATDAGANDAAPAVATHTGVISILEVRLRNMGGPGIDGYGVQLGISFVDDSTTVAPILQESASALDGCKVWELTPAQFAATIGTDEGPVQVTATDGSPVFPPCIFAGTGVGYVCPDSASSGAGGALSATNAPAGTSLFTPAGAATFGAEDVGRFLRLSATGLSALNTSFPIVAVINATTIVLATGTGINLALPPSATFTTLAGVGPIPGTTATTFFTNTEQVTVAKPASAHFEALPANTGFPGANGIGDDFTLGSASGKVLPTTIPTDGTAFTIGCDDTPSCGTALGTILDIVTTDATLGSSPFSFPSPATKRVQIRCIKIGAGSVTVPATYAARLTHAMSGATRIRVQFSRVNNAGVQNQTSAPNVTNVAGGHSEVGFVTPP